MNSTPSFFLKNIVSPGFTEKLSSTERADLDQFLRDMESGPADGNMDIDWQESGRGYYKHLHALSRLNGDARSEYHADLLRDIEAWRAMGRDNLMVSTVAEQLTAGESDH